MSYSHLTSEERYVISENMISQRTRNNEKIKEQKVHEQTHATESQCSSILQK